MLRFYSQSFRYVSSVFRLLIDRIFKTIFFFFRVLKHHSYNGVVLDDLFNIFGEIIFGKKIFGENISDPENRQKIVQLFDRMINLNAKRYFDLPLKVADALDMMNTVINSKLDQKDALHSCPHALYNGAVPLDSIKVKQKLLLQNMEEGYEKCNN